MTIQEQMFCKVYASTGSKIKSSYHAFLCNSLKDRVKEEDLTQKDLTNLKSAGTRMMSKDYIQKEILNIYETEIEKVGIVKLNEMLAYLSFVLRKSKDNITDSTLRRDAIKSCEIMLRRYDYKDTGIDTIVFSRGTEENSKNEHQIN